ncbi:MAG TPA: serine/threonine-protein kinase [Gemmatimonadaceae bacterium]|nr:serine/threonine-protein kinase [Gemmatimonadaceae bacterium]
MRALVERALGAHYELDAEIGRGGMGIVYRARDRRLKRVVAIKVLPPELAFRSDIKTRFLREAETAAQLNHPNIVPIYTVDEAQGLVFFEMAYVSGENLAKRLHDRGVLPVEEVRRILRDVADALAYAHERGVVHRDIKPDNILLDADSGRPMVTDFGIARAVSDGDSRLTATGMAIGTPAYMSPEQAAGERVIDGRSDIYALGIVAYQMLAGEPPFSAGSTPAMLVKHISEMPVPIAQRRADVPDDLARAVMVMLEKDPANRFPSAGDLIKALDGGVIPMPTSSLAPGVVGLPSAAAGAALTTGIGGTPPSAVDGAYDGGNYVPTADDLRRWDAPQVKAFRKRVWPYLYVNGVIVVMSIFTSTSFTFVTVIWSIVLAFKYAKLWSDGYDWRDVFQQPRDRELMEVFDDFMEHVRALASSKKRRALLDARRQRRLARRSAGAPDAGAIGGPRLNDGTLAQAAGPYADTVRQAIGDRDEILRLIQSMPAADRARVPDVERSALALYEKVQGLAITLADVEHNTVPGGIAAYEAEIVRLEGAANPLDHRASEERVHRLAFLKRQRRAIADLEQKRAAVAARLETCALALRNMKLDVLRLRAGMQTHQHITSLAMNALSLADSVDSAVYVADALGQATARPGAARSTVEKR